LNTTDTQTTEAYASHKKVYPREVHGLFASLRISGVLVLLGLYYFIPWISWDGHQSVLFDLPARKFHIFGLTFWPQDFFYLAILLIIAALSLFFFTALAGRLWCGYACPQTVWTEVFLWIEGKIEGGRSKQIKLDHSPWVKYKFVRKTGKHIAWIVFALWTGFTFVGFFTPISELGHSLLNVSLGPWETFWIVFYGVATYGNAGWMREQVCIYMCPYARFQSAMFDKNTLVISYDENRGEPRGSRRKGLDYKRAGLGDCVDCTMCVQACPTGIDIRDGLQYQCIGCAACVDICNEVMDKVGYSRGLIKYTTENALEGKPTRVLRPRMIVYAVLLCAMGLGLIYSMATRVPLGLDIIRDRNALYREADNGWIENIYTLKIINMDKTDHRLSLSAEGISGLRLQGAAAEFTAAAGQVMEKVVRLQADPEVLNKAGYDINFRIQAIDQPVLTLTEKGRFIAPVRY